jgi:lysophospholipase L1-like esterase
MFMGDSFIAASAIPEETMTLAIAAGVLASGTSYLDASVSGTRLADGAISRQYTQAAASNPIRYVIMNGGATDCLQTSDSDSQVPAVEDLYAEMAADGVEKVVFLFQPDPAGAFGGATSALQTCLDEFRPKIKALCDSQLAPKCYWLDLSETAWDGNEEVYSSDGIHANAEGSRVTAEALWDVMTENCVAQ